MPLCFKATIHRIVQLTITLGVSSGGLEVAAQWAGRQFEGLVTAFVPLYSWVYR